jgi:membrane protease YdiL (CAAX protease family)
LLPKEEFPVALALAYGISATAVFAGTSLFFARRGVAPNQIWTWAEGEPPTPRKEQTLDDYLAHRDLSFAEKFGLTGGGLVPALLAGLIVGAALGGLAHGYTALLHHIPMLTDLLRNVDSTTSRAPGLRVAYAITAIAFAPFAEEYLFRGLLYRALDRNWGGWRAILGAAAFFTIYHPLLAWPLVFSVGAVNCLLFRRTKRLLPCIVLHMAYNTAVFLR